MNANMQVGEIFATINLLNYKNTDIPHAKKGKELGYIQSLTVTYGLNMIPVANITIPLGSELHQDGSTSPSYAYGGAADSIYKLGDDSTPVGIYIRGAFFDTLGKSNVQEFCIFKGYITDTAYERSSGSASMSVKLIHWLCHLTEFPLVSSLLAPQTPHDIAAQYPIAVSKDLPLTMGRPDASGYNVNFTPAVTAVKALRKITSGANIWDALKALFVGLNPDPSKLRKTDPGYVSKPYLERVSGALDAVVGADLDFISKAQSEYQTIKNSVAKMLGSLSCGYFNGSTIWDKLVNSFLPAFYMSLTPRVCEANIIPAPGQCMGASKFKYITKSEYYQTSYSRLSFPTLFGGVLLYMDPSIHRPIDHRARTSIRFPEKLQPGPLRVVTAPAWLSSDLVAVAGQNIMKDTSFYKQYEKQVIKQNTAKVEEAKKKSRGIVERILENLVRITFQIIACSDRKMSINMPLRMDMTAGEMVAIELPSGVVEAGQECIYGTIDSITLNITPSVAQTTLTLSNIRTQKEMLNKDLTSSEGIMYSKAWKTNPKLTLCEKII